MRRGSLAFIAALLVAPATTYADTVTCADGTTSDSGRGACSHHGGIAKTRAAQPRSQGRDRTDDRRTADRSRDASGGLIARCRDGSISLIEGRGACSHHGGVASRPRANRTERQAREAEPTQRRTQPPPKTRVDTEAETRVPTPGLVVKCDDGTVSPAGRGACSHHGGIAGEHARNTDTDSDVREQKVNPEAPTARCKDGTVSYSLHHSGTCSSHGGVREWLD